MLELQAPIQEGRGCMHWLREDPASRHVLELFRAPRHVSGKLRGKDESQ